MSTPPADSPERDLQKTTHTLLDVVSRVAKESSHARRGAQPVALDSLLDRDLGLDSLGKSELLRRIETAFGVGLSEQALLAETPRDLLRAVLAAVGGPSHVAQAEAGIPVPEKAEAEPLAAQTLPEVLDWHVRTHPGRVHIYVYGDGEQFEEITYSALLRGAQAVAAGLLSRGLQPGQAVAIMLPTSPGYFFSFFGTLLAGGIPVPIYPPVRPSQIEEHLRRHARILGNARAYCLITVPEATAVARLLRLQVDSLRDVLTVDELSSETAALRPRGQGDDIAFLQYTSGSTGDPKGVILTHANLLANIRAMGMAVGVQSTDVFVSWLPLYHDMGLIGAWLGGLYYAYPLVVMSPLRFLAHPARWLWAIHRHRATLSAAPNFGFELCLRKLDEQELEGLDLSTWRLAFNGAEPVSPETVTQFSRRFARYGFRREAMAPVYGLAECSLGLAFPPAGRGLVVDDVRRDVFVHSGRAEPAGGHEIADRLRFVACGRPLPGYEVRIVDAAGIELPERQEGRLEFKGPSTTSGYFRNPEATRRLFHGEWLDSGDRAYMAGGELYLTGRVKDLIIRGGRNLYPYELEEAVGAIPGVRKGCVAVFGSSDPESGTERFVVVAETRETSTEALERLQGEIRNITVDLWGLPPDDVVLAPPHAVLKTSSGKIRRAATRDSYERDTFRRRPRAVGWQVARVAWSSAMPELRRLLRLGSDVLYAGYAKTIFWLLVPFVWSSVVVAPRIAWRWAIIRGAIRVLRGLTGTRLQVRGLEHLASTEPCVVVANHASYLDSLVLIDGLGCDVSYVAKQELHDRFVSRVFLRRIDTLFVERFDPQRSAAEGRRVVEAVRGGNSLVFFPEGTFDRIPGLLPFRMGAFVAAAESGVPVVPVAIRGTRSILRSGSWFPRRGRIEVHIGQPIRAKDSSWQAAVGVRDAARVEILRHSGEPDRADETIHQ